MGYKVIITPPAKRRLDMFVAYVKNEFRNSQAAKNILLDAKESKVKLLTVADIVKKCDNPILAKHGYHKFKFLRHDFVMLYRIDGNKVIVDGMFHELQDYESVFIREMDL